MKKNPPDLLVTNTEWRRWPVRQHLLHSDEWQEYLLAWGSIQNWINNIPPELPKLFIAKLVRARKASDTLIQQLLEGLEARGHKENRNAQHDPKIRARALELAEAVKRDKPKIKAARTIASLTRKRLAPEIERLNAERRANGEKPLRTPSVKVLTGWLKSH